MRAGGGGPFSPSFVPEVGLPGQGWGGGLSAQSPARGTLGARHPVR